MSQPVPQPKQKIVAGLLALLVGGPGIHNFYLGYQKKAVTQLILFVLCVTAPIAGIWALYDAIMIFTDKVTAADGTPLV